MCSEDGYKVKELMKKSASCGLFDTPRPFDYLLQQLFMKRDSKKIFELNLEVKSSDVDVVANIWDLDVRMDVVRCS